MSDFDLRTLERQAPTDPQAARRMLAAARRVGDRRSVLKARLYLNDETPLPSFRSALELVAYCGNEVARELVGAPHCHYCDSPAADHPIAFVGAPPDCRGVDGDRVIFASGFSRWGEEAALRAALAAVNALPADSPGAGAPRIGELLRLSHLLPDNPMEYRRNLHVVYSLRLARTYLDRSGWVDEKTRDVIAGECAWRADYEDEFGNLHRSDPLASTNPDWLNSILWAVERHAGLDPAISKRHPCEAIVHALTVEPTLARKLIQEELVPWALGEEPRKAQG